MKRIIHMLNIVLILSITLITITGFIVSVVQASTIEGVLGGNADPVKVDSDTASSILGAIQWIGYAIAIGMLIYVGIKYVTSAADERANLKNAMIYYVIGAILISAATTIVGIIFNISN